MSELPDRHAAVIGIDAYGHGVAPLSSAVADARAIARVLESGHGYNTPDVLLDAAASRSEILRILEEALPRRIGTDSAVVRDGYQTPGLWPLRPENTGEFIFLSPRQEVRTRPDPPLDDAHNPWPGLAAYGEDDSAVFFGRRRVVRDLVDRLVDGSRSPLLAVVGASGTGKSSLVKAGLLPRLSGGWTLVSAPRLAGDPRTLLADAERQLAGAPEGDRRLLFIDQFEELYTQCPDAEARHGFLERLRRLVSGDEPVRVLLTLRSDFEPLLRSSEALDATRTGEPSPRTSMS